MIKQIIRVAIGVLAVAVIAALGYGWFKRDQLTTYWMSPKYHFADQQPIRSPVYLIHDEWAARPDEKDNADLVPPGTDLKDNQALAKVDVFFVPPTTYYGTDWNADAKDPNPKSIWDGPVAAFEASVFNGCCRVFMPYYRQSHAASIKRSSGDGRNAWDLSTVDVVRAFDSFLKGENKGRPFIIAGDEQGAVLASHLLDLRVEGNPAIERFVGAYLIGAGFPTSRFGTNLKVIKACESATDTRCVVSWETYVEGTNPRNSANVLEVFYDRRWTQLSEAGRNCINPLTWVNNGPKADAALNKGALVTDWGYSLGINLVMGARPKVDPKNFTALPKPTPGYVSAECRDGFLMVSAPKDAVMREGFRGAGNLHLENFTLFYMNLRQNLIDRSEAFLATWKPGVPTLGDMR